MRNFAIGSLVILFATLAGTAAAGDRASASKPAGSGTTMNSTLASAEGKCTSNGHSYGVGMSACVDGSIRKCGQVVTLKKSKEVTSIGWVNQNTKCSP